MLSGSGFSFTRQRWPEIMRNLIFFLNSERFRDNYANENRARLIPIKVAENIREYQFLNCLSVRLDEKVVGLCGSTSSFAKFYE